MRDALPLPSAGHRGHPQPAPAPEGRGVPGPPVPHPQPRRKAEEGASTSASSTSSSRESFVVTVHPDRGAGARRGRAPARSPVPQPASRGHVLYVLLDTVVDGYFPHPRRHRRRDRASSRTWSSRSPTRTTSSASSTSSASWCMLRKVVAPQRDVHDACSTAATCPTSKTERRRPTTCATCRTTCCASATCVDTFRDLLSSRHRPLHVGDRRTASTGWSTGSPWSPSSSA